jgi:hypothetical protein
VLFSELEWEPGLYDARAKIARRGLAASGQEERQMGGSVKCEREKRKMKSDQPNGAFGQTRRGFRARAHDLRARRWVIREIGSPPRL